MWYSEPYSLDELDKVEDRAGVYVVLDVRRGGRLRVLDVGESARVRSRLAAHDRKREWLQKANGEPQVMILYTPYRKRQGRRQIERALRSWYNPLCGKR